MQVQTHKSFIKSRKICICKRIILLEVKKNIVQYITSDSIYKLTHDSIIFFYQNIVQERIFLIYFFKRKQMNDYISNKRYVFFIPLLFYFLNCSKILRIIWSFLLIFCMMVYQKILVFQEAVPWHDPR